MKVVIRAGCHDMCHFPYTPDGLLRLPVDLARRVKHDTPIGESNHRHPGVEVQTRIMNRVLLEPNLAWNADLEQPPVHTDGPIPNVLNQINKYQSPAGSVEERHFPNVLRSPD